MSRIRLLPEALANKIAAGEVVERPASVVKELLENSLDAGARNLEITVQAGGKRLMRVLDDGEGMTADDALLAFERHATSKIYRAEDLGQIQTLGFRGEALPSMAGVSRLLMETQAKGERVGTAVEIAGSRIVGVREIARAVGTTVTVRDLFFNLPARKKFLRGDRTELGHVVNVVTQYALAHPEGRFALAGSGSRVFDFQAVDRLRERLFQVFGAGSAPATGGVGDRAAVFAGFRIAPKSDVGRIKSGFTPSSPSRKCRSPTDNPSIFL